MAGLVPFISVSARATREGVAPGQGLKGILQVAAGGSLCSGFLRKT